MSLEGTLETISLPDVLALLSVTAKSGELRVESAGGVGRVWLDAGRVAGFAVGGQHSAVDALFALLRLKDGSFKFHTGTEPLEPRGTAGSCPSDGTSRRAAIAMAGDLGRRSLVVVETEPRRAGRLRGHPFARAVGPGRIDRWRPRCRSTYWASARLGEFDGCKAVKELVELGLVQVDRIDLPAEPVMLIPPPPAEYGSALPAEFDVPPAPELHEEDHVANGWSEAELSNLSDVWNDETGQVESVPVEVEEDQPEAGQPVNRGLLLKFLGSARS